MRKQLPSALPWTGFIDGDDVVVEDVKATWFGGDDDPQDSGYTASGVVTRGKPELMGCALPVIAVVMGVRYYPTADSPLAVIPRIPWFIPVEVTRDGRKVTVELIDNGPNVKKYPNNAIDLTKAAFTQLGGDIDEGSMIVSFRVKGAAKFFRT